MEKMGELRPEGRGWEGGIAWMGLGGSHGDLFMYVLFRFVNDRGGSGCTVDLLG